MEAALSKPFIEELITKSSKFPASQAPEPIKMAKIKPRLLVCLP